MAVDFPQGVQSTIPGMNLDPILDDSVILEGSLAEWGYRIPFTGEHGKVFEYRQRGGKLLLEVYPLDGLDHPVCIEISRFVPEQSLGKSVVAAIHAAYQIRADILVDDQAT